MRDSFDDGENSIYNGRGFGMRHIHGELVEKAFPKSKKEYKDLKRRQIWTKDRPKDESEPIPRMFPRWRAASLLADEPKLRRDEHKERERRRQTNVRCECDQQVHRTDTAAVFLRTLQVEKARATATFKKLLVPH